MKTKFPVQREINACFVQRTIPHWAKNVLVFVGGAILALIAGYVLHKGFFIDLWSPK